MNPDKIPDHLSPAALKELKAITAQEYPNESMTDEEIEKMGLRLLRYFASLVPAEASKPLRRIEVTENERKVLSFLHSEIVHNNRNPSVRDVAHFLGFRSSRSGHKMIDQLKRKGLLFRNLQGRLEPAPGVEEMLCQ